MFRISEYILYIKLYIHIFLKKSLIQLGQEIKRKIRGFIIPKLLCLVATLNY